MRTITTTVLAILAIVSLFACRSSDQQFRRYPVDGKVLSVNSDKKTLKIAHKEIPGLMGAMTMDYSVNEGWVMRQAKPGDHITASLVLDPAGAYLDNVTLTSTGTPIDASTNPLHEPVPGDVPPDFAFSNQDGKQVKLSELRGKPLLLTFIYTRCPLPDYCIRMSDNFGSIERQLKQNDPGLYGKLQLLSVSIDPEFDTPPVLKNYGKSFAGNVDPKFEHWQFGSADPKDTRAFANFFGLSYDTQAGQIVHSLRTALLDPSGKIVAVYNGNDWRPQDVVRDLKKMQ
ncbi:MAG TPA: SCO family protein [Terriglobales bacterium]|nr:SCO family protein [Terriglobales bacterium]